MMERLPRQSRARAVVSNDYNPSTPPPRIELTTSRCPLWNAVVTASFSSGAFEPRGLGFAAPAAVSPHSVGPLDSSASPGLLPFAGLLGPVFPCGFSVLHRHLFRTMICSCFTSPRSRSHGSCRIVPQGLVVRFGLGLDALCKIKSNQIKSTSLATALSPPSPPPPPQLPLPRLPPPPTSLATSSPPPLHGRRTSQTAADTHVHLSHSTAHRLRVSQHAAAAATSRPPHLPARR